MRFAVLASGYGSNLQAIIRSVKAKEIKASLALVVSDKPKAYALTRAKRAGIPTLVFHPDDFSSREKFDRAIVKSLKEKKIDFVVLAGFMRILSPYFVQRYQNKILNIHPALLPNFKGAHAIKDALKAGADQTGVTVHVVDEQVDHGPVLMQQSLDIRKKETLQSLEVRIHKLEHKIYPQAISQFIRKCSFAKKKKKQKSQ